MISHRSYRNTRINDSDRVAASSSWRLDFRAYSRARMHEGAAFLQLVQLAPLVGM